ncbi:tumor necrosis factor receptor superfamily member 1B-like [Scyliorhinus canicula]|uniref:tumor necrosis factor receptor superfamily member 1B-like n=1 Tax=Scyliorhinus canicula TaxID=7830 RepID=UPI0018F62BD7|nr:tumor necrosis factor receptor superfamily member 1B-like [Scyliorhinus canicula]
MMGQRSTAAPFCLWLLTAAAWSERYQAYKMTCEENQYYNDDQDRCCSYCRPGLYRKVECTSNDDTICEHCKNSTYKEEWSNSYECTLCVGTCQNDQQEVQRCSPTNRQICACKPGMYCKSQSLNFCDHCVQHQKCRVGEGVIKTGNSSKDTVCKPCPKGTFSDVLSDSAKCRPHTNCSQLNTHLVKEGTSSEDAVCSPATRTSTIATSILAISTWLPIDDKLNLTTLSTAVTTPKGNRQMVALYLAIGLLLAFMIILIVASLLSKRKEYFKSLFLSSRAKGSVYIVTPIYVGVDPGNCVNPDQEDPIITHPESHVHFPQQESMKSQNAGDSHIFPVEEEGKLYRDPIPVADY